MLTNKRKVGVILLFILASALLLWYRLGNDSVEKQVVAPIQSVNELAPSYDVIVVGTDPEGIAAAVSAARNGLSTLLMDGKDREILGGLMTLGWLNSLDNNYSPQTSIVPGRHPVLNKGIFQEWYDQVEGTSFDVNTAAQAFHTLVSAEPNIDVLLKVKEMSPIVETLDGKKTVTGIQITKEDGTEAKVEAIAVIDATQDADIAAEAGVPFTIGREDIGDPESNMAVTIVFRLNNVTEEVWNAMRSRAGAAESDAMSIWGASYAGTWEYPTTNPDRIRMRGLNIGRQNDESLLINALQIFNVDPFSEESRQEAYELAHKELPLVVDYMKKEYPELEPIVLGELAPEIYVRESRHMMGEYRLSIVDLLDNRDHWDRIAFGSYRVDIQSTSFHDRGVEIFKPVQYAIPFRSIVPLEVDNLLVVGRSASFDTLAHGSARVIPVGMAAGEAAGASVKLIKETNMTFRELSRSKPDIERLQELLNHQGMELKPIQIEPPKYAKHPAYEGLKAAVSLNIAAAAHTEDDPSEFYLDNPSNAQRMVNHMLQIKKVYSDYFTGHPSNGIHGIEEANKVPLSLSLASYIIVRGLDQEIAREGTELFNGRKYLSGENG